MSPPFLPSAVRRFVRHFKPKPRVACTPILVVASIAAPLSPGSGAYTSRQTQLVDSTRCVPDQSGVSAKEWLAAATTAIGVPRATGHVLRYHASTARELADQSDRAYPPFIQQIGAQDRWLEPATGVERVPLGRTIMLRGPQASYRSSGDTVTPAPQAYATLGYQRRFDPWAVLDDWQRDTSVRVVGRCPYLDFARIVLARAGAIGTERLYIDPVSRFPMKLEAVEIHYFLGPVHDEYRYTTWSDAAPFVYYPAATIKQSDGLGEETWSAFPGEVSLVRSDSAPSLLIPDSAMNVPTIPPPRFGDEVPDTVRVGAHTFLLVNHAFTSVVTLAADTVFVIDATAGEERARRDSTWIGALFPGHHPVTLVLLSAVWPHIAGLRFWVSTGARVVGDRRTQQLVTWAVARRWTEHPDQLERHRRFVHLRFQTVTDSTSMARGQVRLYELRGAGNEGTMMSYLPSDRFIWASDRIQDIQAPSLYTTELARSVRQLGIQPQWTSGPHFQLVPWAQIDGLSSQ